MPWDESEPAVKGKSGFEAIARDQCKRLLESRAARRFPAQAEALVMIAFVYGAAWALGKPDITALADAQIEALQQQGSKS